MARSMSATARRDGRAGQDAHVDRGRRAFGDHVHARRSAQLGHRAGGAGHGGELRARVGQGLRERPRQLRARGAAPSPRMPPIRAPRASRRPIVGSMRCGASGWFSSRRIARASSAVDPPGSGMAAWPPDCSTTSSTFMMPFSVSPTTAVGPRPGSSPSMTAPPSSTTSQGAMPRSASTADDRRRARAARLLVVPEDQVDVGCGREAGGEARLDRFEDRHERRLVVERPAAPDRGVVALADEFGGERRMRPPAVVVDRDDILMRHQHRSGPVAGAPPPVQQAAPGDHLALQRGVHEREEPLEVGVEAREGLLDTVRALVRVGRVAQQRAEAVEGGIAHAPILEAASGGTAIGSIRWTDEQPASRIPLRRHRLPAARAGPRAPRRGRDVRRHRLHRPGRLRRTSAGPSRCSRSS